MNNPDGGRSPRRWMPFVLSPEALATLVVVAAMQYGLSLAELRLAMGLQMAIGLVVFGVALRIGDGIRRRTGHQTLIRRPGDKR